MWSSFSIFNFFLLHILLHSKRSQNRTFAHGFCRHAVFCRDVKTRDNRRIQTDNETPQNSSSIDACQQIGFGRN